MLDNPNHAVESFALGKLVAAHSVVSSNCNPSVPSYYSLHVVDNIVVNEQPEGELDPSLFVDASAQLSQDTSISKDFTLTSPSTDSVKSKTKKPRKQRSFGVSDTHRQGTGRVSYILQWVY